MQKLSAFVGLSGYDVFARVIKIATGLACALLLMQVPLRSQVNTGRILGTVTDQSGGVIAGAMVAVTNSQTGVARNLVTDQAGEYLAPNLIPGTYTVHVTANGFQTFERQNILLEIGKDARIDAQLTPGQITQTVEVKETVPLLDTTSATVAGTLDTSTLTDLPLNGRNYQNLLVLRPGVILRPGGGTLTTSTNGLRPEDNNYFIEGLDNAEPFTGQSIVNSTLPSGDAATIFPVDAIQEVNVESNAPAEFGRRPGSVVNLGIKSGTNTIHGSAYAFGRNQSFDAKDFNAFADPTAPVSPVELEQWGVTAGGPIVKNKLFYFGAFERQTYNVGNAFSAKVPTSAAGAGTDVSIPDAEAALNASCAATPGQSFCTGSTFTPNALSLKLLPLYGPNSSNGSGVAVGFPNVVASDNVVGKVDYHASDHHTFAGSYFYGKGTSTAEDTVITQPYFRSLGTLQAQFVTTSWTWTPNSTWVNDLRFGWDHHERIVKTFDNQSPASSYGLNTGITNPNLGGFPTINVGGFSQLGGDNNLPKGYGPSSVYDLVDHVSYLRGKHAFKFGGEARYFHAPYGSFSAGRGVFFFQTDDLFPGSTSLESFLAGVPHRANLLEGNAARVFTQWDYSAFAEDVWRVKSDVTVNLGLRWEYFTPLSEIHNLIGNWEPQVGLEQVGTNINSAYNGYHKDISPRLGVAWDIGGKGKTVVRAGAGIYYVDLIAGGMLANVSLPGHSPGISSIPTLYTRVLPDGTQLPPVNPVSGIGSTTVKIPGSQLNWSLAGPVLPATSTSAFECGDGVGSDPAPCSILAMNRNLIQPSVDSWNLSIQHSLTNNLSLEANYIGNHGHALPGILELNQVNPNSPGELACGNCEAVANRPYGAQYPYLAYIDYLTNVYSSNYNGLQVTLTGRSYHGLSFLAGYTYSHALDDSSSLYNMSLPQDSLHFKQDYGNSDYDLRHHFSLSITYNIPGKKSPAQLLQGWTVNSAVVLQSGLPWTATDGSDDVSLTGTFQDRWDFFGNPKDFNGGANPIPFYRPDQPAPFNVFPAMCTQEATAIGTAGAGSNLENFGCYAQGNSVLIAPPAGTFGTAGRNIFRDNGFRDWDFSLFKNWTVKERLTAQFRAEFFNILNKTILANPGVAGNNDPSAQPFGCGCETPDQAATNPILGTGGARAIQLGLKLLF